MVEAFKRWLGPSSEDRASKWVFTTMLVFAALSLLASFVLSAEEFQYLKNPSTPLACNINLILNCGEVMKTWQAHLFGFPNAFIGLMAEPVVITVAVAGLAGVKFPRSFMFAAQVFYAFGSLFAYWLFFQSVYVIQELCPWCLLVTLSTTMIFESMLRYNIRENNLYLSPATHQKALAFIKKDYDKFIAAGWIALLVALMLIKFPNIFS